MGIGDIIKQKDYETYKKLAKMCKESRKKEKEIELGDSIHNLMKANSYKRVNGAIRQTRWEGYV